MKKLGIFLMAVISAIAIVSCASSKVDADDAAIARGVNAWNKREPAAANAYWADIKNSETNKKYMNYINLYNAGVEALNSTDSIKSTNESKLLAACNTALSKFSALDPALDLPADVAEKGAVLTAERINKLLAAENISAAKKMHTTAVTVYGENPALTEAGKNLEVVTAISSKKSALVAQGKKALEVEDFDAKIVALDKVLANYTSTEAEMNSTAAKAGVASNEAVTSNIKRLKKARQDLAIQREGIIRDKAYDFKDRIGEEFARQPAEGSGTGKNGAFTSYDILAHYKSVQANIDKIYGELLAFAGKYPKDISQDVLDDVKAMKDDLNAKIAQISREIAVAEEIASRGKTVMPLMIGLFNPAPGSTKESQKSRPAKFSATGVKKDEYWWGMVSIKKGEMNDLVITLKDNRNVRVFNQNTHSGKDIEKKGLKDLVSKANKVGNSWPVLNAAKALGSDKYFFEIQKGKTDSYSGEVVVYSSFITRSR